MAVALARKLCEAVENEDAKEVENLLNCGVDPNLVLPEGIAAIHLASGKESESALRCLTIILRQGGDPNVRSIEELTPVHVAASWGCCKALTFLLRKGGDPNLQDQDGNTALDLALMEKNRRCVVALQEYNQRGEEMNISPDQICDYYKNNSCKPDEIPEMSSITLLLESVCEVSPCCSTKISPFISAPKNAATVKGADNAALASQMELAGFDSKGRSEESEHKFAGLESSEIQLNDKMTNSASDLKTDHPESKCDVLTLQNWHCITESSCHFYPDTDVGNSSAKTANKAHVVPNSGERNNSGIHEKGIIIASLNLPSQANCAVNRTDNAYVNSLMNHTSKFTKSQIKLEGWEGLDVTSPDHVYTYSRGHSDSDMEETLVLPKTDDMTEYEGLRGKDISSSSKYSSCFSDAFTALTENSDSSEKAAFDSDVNCKSLLDSKRNKVCSQNDGNADKRTNLCCMLNVDDSVAGAVNLPERVEDMDNDELTSNNAQMLNCKYLISSSQNMVSDGHERETVRTTETLHTSQSPTIPISDINALEICSQDLRTRLRDLLLSSKGCGLVVDQSKHSLPDCFEPRGKSSCSSTVPVISQTNPPVGQNVKSISATCLNTSVDTLVVGSADHEIKALDSELCDLKKMLLATKISEPVSTILSKEKSPCFFTERTKSRLLSSKSRSGNSSLFEESLEMPQRCRRLRSPDSKSGSPVPSAEAKKSFIHNGLLYPSKPTAETYVAQNNTCLVQTTNDARGNISEPETTVSISNFLTDDLSSEMDVKFTPQLKKTSRDPYIQSRISESVWLTEDGDTESSGEADHKLAVFGKQANKLEEPMSAASQTGSFLHSTLIEDLGGSSTKGPRYSFSRSSCVPKDTTGIQLTSLSESVIEEAHLSPGGRPVTVAHFEPVEYLYMDNDKGHALVERHLPCTNQSSSSMSDTSDDTIIYDWRNYSICKEKIKLSPVCTSNRVAVELYRLSNEEIGRRLRELGEDPGQVNSKTRKVCILLLDKRLKAQTTSGPGGLFFEYSPELSIALRTYDIPDCNNDEAALSQEFDQPDKTRKWREGILKSSFNYLLLDPRVTRNLPYRCHTLSLPECFRTFVRAVFYVGKGKRARPYCHLYESLAHSKGSSKQPCSKVQHIVDIWRSGQGVLSLHCFQNTIPVEAYTREACMVDAIGLKMLTNQKKGVYYGQAQNWTLTRRRHLGVHMLHRAMRIFLAEGERQLRPPDIRTGP